MGVGGGRRVGEGRRGGGMVKLPVAKCTITFDQDSSCIPWSVYVDERVFVKSEIWGIFDAVSS